MNKIVGYTGLSSFGRVTGIGERKPLNSKPEECFSVESVEHWRIILRLSSNPRRVAGSIQTFTTINQ